MTFMRDSQSVSRVLASLGWKPGSAQGRVVAGGNGMGNRLDQLHSPTGLAFDPSGCLIIADAGNSRVIRKDIEDIEADSGKSTQRCLQFVSDDQLREIEEVWVDDVRYSQPSIQRRIADFIVLRGRHGLKPG